MKTLSKLLIVIAVLFCGAISQILKSIRKPHRTLIILSTKDINILNLADMVDIVEWFTTQIARASIQQKM